MTIVFVVTCHNSWVRRAVSDLDQKVLHQDVRQKYLLRLTGLDHRQRRLVSNDLFPAVKSAAKSTIASCEAAFNESRWNCSSLEQLPELSSELYTGMCLLATSNWQIGNQKSVVSYCLLSVLFPVQSLALITIYSLSGLLPSDLELAFLSHILSDKPASTNSLRVM